ncbi:hypothetical protein DCAR_0518670 [Daucus carota subsp. sativus]|uniref:Uncharacterized protein n=1 Tax=Daucus carota subsp. sativus TaxID=79200 RepID=A0AAF0X106_DAUCS|nr:hypothetical protein DCAR_0518670 [Daucus carota subsp. sativus]
MVSQKKIPSRKPVQQDEVGNCSTIVNRHRFLLTACILLALLCIIYLYLAVNFGPEDLCSGLSGVQRTQCQWIQAKNLVAKGKYRIL